jgi:hypothetical protein
MSADPPGVPASAPEEKTIEKKEPAFKGVLKVLAYPVSALIGYAFAKPLIHDGVYDNLKRYHAFDDIRASHHAKLHEMIRDFNGGKPVDVLNQTRSIKAAYESQLSDQFDRLGLGTLEKQWRFLDKTQQRNVLMTGFTAAGIGIGAMLTIANNKSVSALAQKKESEKSQNTPG